jgi:hypothetical protein
VKIVDEQDVLRIEQFLWSTQIDVIEKSVEKERKLWMRKMF